MYFRVNTAVQATYNILRVYGMPHKEPMTILFNFYITLEQFGFIEYRILLLNRS